MMAAVVAAVAAVCLGNGPDERAPGNHVTPKSRVVSDVAVASDKPAAPGFRRMTSIPAGVHRPLFRMPDEPRVVPVEAFRMDLTPVTNGDFLEFVRRNPRWRRSMVKRVFADEGYLAHWRGDLDLGEASASLEAQPVTRVSWFAAKAYAAWRGCRLPSTSEWECVASAGFASRDGSREPAFVAQLNRWYATPSSPSLPAVAGGRPNYFGVHDLHGVIWEWTADFNSELVTGDARGDTGIERELFCGAGSQGAADRTDFPAFMRSALRSSLRASYTLPNLGFRCAMTPPESTRP